MTVRAAELMKVWGDRDKESHRQYHTLHKVTTTSPLRYTGEAYVGDGPESISGAANLPVIGDIWNFGNDNDSWAICTPQRSIRPYKWTDKNPICNTWHVETLFATRPFDRCMTAEWGDPLSEPQKVRGGSVRYTIEAARDRFEVPILTSAFEPIRGPQVEFDGGRDQVVIEQNVADLELALCTSLRNKLNDDVLWGVQPRRIKLSDFQWEQLYYGLCYYYFRRTFTFDIRNNPKDLFDRDLLDEGTKVLSGDWDPDTGYWHDIKVGGAAPDNTNPQHFVRYKDRNGENARVVLDGKGRPADAILLLGTGGQAGTGTDSTDSAGNIHVEYYDEADLTALNIPTNLEYGSATP